MEYRLSRMSALLIMTVANAAFAQPGPLWLGTWNNQGGDTSMTISASKLVFVAVHPDEKGKPETHTAALRWTNRSDDAAGELEEFFGYAKKRINLGDIAKRYEEALLAYRRDPTDFSVSDPAKSRQAISAMSPGIYKVLWSYSGGDCGYDEYIIDGDKILDVSECKYQFKVQLYNRVR